MKPQNDFQYEKRNRLTVLGWVLVVFILVQNFTIAQNDAPIKLSWLGGKPPSLSTGVSWGVPLPEGKI